LWVLILGKSNNIDISPEMAIHEIKEITQLKYVLPKSRLTEIEILQPTELQSKLLAMEI
jgi:hypothetical protein